MKWKTDSEVAVITQNFTRRCGTRTENEDWNIYWANAATVKGIFHPESGQRLGDAQLINHYPNHYELTRKDLMVKNIKRYLRDASRDATADLPPDFVPVTYMLPADYSLFVEEFRRCPNAMWIMKPANAAQGRGIFIINKLSQIKRWSNGRWANMPLKEAYVISRYIEDPMLIGGKKFDLRLYVLVTSYRPLRVYQYDAGFARFCNVKYSSQAGELNNPFIHLTNVAIQKHNDDYNVKHGGKWNLQHVRLFVEATWGREASAKLFDDIDRIIIHSLKAVQGSIINDRHCFECYGYDILIDARLRPWLVEVNASPSLSTTTHSDRVMKMALIRDVLDVVLPKDITNYRGAFTLGPCEDAGGFSVLYDEALEAQLKAEAEQAAPNRGAQRRGSQAGAKQAPSRFF
ncbi:hypothetical protein AURANDRAFT_33385 [Aureococcus anophagefferens]|uniref:Tubulin-tyrosine ligase n=1 Tax=Aureococcus anophagefferens TaxID=44056 RepID=F0YM10_AURAN|nr:hypothetical protein AURANDRAFT_33385 [Aureococcus anophagefferens]EGB03869.1 hypothetical protein AURANDRAFT_33385 [Aureococcus anophagefferens]|eukprot:XP_009041421.1 hypothetical protein AURANDRAFT_33385 [Aureococcus anophagefferens]